MSISPSSTAQHVARHGRLTRFIACLSIVALQVNALTPTWAALSQKPLLANSAGSVKPNVILTLDNSGSMAYSHMPEDLAGSRSIEMYVPKSVEPPLVFPSTGSCAGKVFECKVRSSSVNTIYYNPAVYYRPWVSSSDPSKRMAAAPFNAAPVSPLDTSQVVDLSAVADREAKWCSASGCNNGTVASTQKFNPAVFYLKTGTSADSPDSYLACDLNGTGCSYGRANYPERTDCPATGNCPLSTERQNFANWFTYYRTRMLLAKAAVSEAFASQANTIRLGWGFTSTATSSNEVDGLAILGGPVQGVRDFTSDYRKLFIKTIQGRATAFTTPLRYAMQGVGEYFKRTDARSPWQSDPSTGTSTGPLACRRAYHILTTDGYYNDDYSSVGNVDDSKSIGPGASPHYERRAPYVDAVNTNSLADVAMHYWANDLQPDIDDTVPTNPRNLNPKDPAAYYDPGHDPATWQHLTQFTLSVGMSGTLNPATDLPALIAGTKTWPSVSTGDDKDQAKIDDLWHAAVNSRGKFYMVKDSSSFKDAIKDAIGKTDPPAQHEGGVGIAGVTIQGSQRKYIPRYDTHSDAPWSGDLEAYDLDSGGKVIDEKNPTWTASKARPGAAERKLYVWNPDAGAAVPFAWTGMGASNQSLLPADSGALINYVRGDTSNEGVDDAKFREREGAKFADFINSTPLYVKDHVNLKYGSLPVGGGSYASFVLDTKSSRTPVIFLGGNGGFLHAFRDADGQEIFGFAPRGVLANLPKLATQDYGRAGDGNEHQFFVDGQLIESDAYFASKGAWRNVLVGTLGAGGRGVYALDVTSLGSLGANSVLWDQTLPSDNDVGSIVSAPQVGVLPDGSWKVFVGNGYDSPSGAAALLMYNMEDGKLSSKGKLVVGPTGDGNGLGGVRLLRNSKGEVVGAYAGDLKGNLWRFEYDAEAKAMRVGYSGSPLFKATDSGGKAQPITAPPGVIVNPSGGSVIVFGTGRLLAEDDKASKDTQSLYGLWDKNGIETPTAGLSSPLAVADGSTPRSQLIEQTVTPALLPGAFNVTSHAPTGTSKGWFMDLTIEGGQRLIYPVQTLSAYALFETVAIQSGATACDDTTAKGFNFLLPAATGAQGTFPILDINGDGEVTSLDGNSSGYSTGADGQDTVLPGDGTSTGSGSGGGPGSNDCQIQNTGGKINCKLPNEKGVFTTIADRVWKRLLIVPQPAP